MIVPAAPPMVSSETHPCAAVLVDTARIRRRFQRPRSLSFRHQTIARLIAWHALVQCCAAALPLTPRTPAPTTTFLWANSEVWRSPFLGESGHAATLPTHLRNLPATFPPLASR